MRPTIELIPATIESPGASYAISATHPDATALLTLKASAVGAGV